MKEKLEEAIKQMTHNAMTASNADDALKYSQAAFSLAQSLAALNT